MNSGGRWSQWPHLGELTGSGSLLPSWARTMVIKWWVIIIQDGEISQHGEITNSQGQSQGQGQGQGQGQSQSQGQSQGQGQGQCQSHVI